jgi:hydroxypyruvate reductase
VTAIDAPAAAGRALALELYDAAVAAAAPGPATARAVDALPIERGSRLWIFAFGKAARPMAAAAVTSTLRSLHSIVGGLIVAPDDAPSPYPTIVSMRGDHPLPGRHSFDASAKIAEIASGRRGSDVAIVLLSGGASSLIGAPVRAINESDFVVLQELLLGSGLDIAATNLVRKRFSRWGAGRLALALAPATTHCLAISDVAGDDLSVIGSGPCIPDGSSVADVTNLLQRANLFARLPATCRDLLTGVTRGTVPETPAKSHPAFAHITGRVIGNNRLALDGIAAKADDLRLATSIAPDRLGGEAARAGEAIARALVSAASQGASNACFAWGGETTVTLAAPNGATAMGGRCQELALAAARVLHQAGGDAAGIALLAAGTDGRDGATDAAGAIVDHTTWSAVSEGGRDPAQALAAHESYKALRAASALIPRRDTGTNVNDVVVGVIVR